MVFEILESDVKLQFEFSQTELRQLVSTLLRGNEDNAVHGDNSARHFVSHLVENLSCLLDD